MDLLKAKLTTQLKKQVCDLELTANFADEVVSHCTFLNYDKASMLFIQGSPADLAFYVFAGVVKIYCPRSNGTRILMNVAGPGDLIGCAVHPRPHAEAPSISRPGKLLTVNRAGEQRLVIDST